MTEVALIFRTSTSPLYGALPDLNISHVRILDFYIHRVELEEVTRTMTDHLQQIMGGVRIHSLGLAMMKVSSSPAGKIQMTGAVIGMMQAGLNQIKRKNLRVRKPRLPRRVQLRRTNQLLKDF